MVVENPTSLEGGFSKKAKEMLLSLNISFSPGEFEDIYRITSRDTEGGSYPYNAGFSAFGKTRKNWIVVKDNVEIGFYYTGLTKDEKRGKKIGEVGMIHLAPAMRGKGLLIPFMLLGSIELIEAGAQILRSVVGDETGKVEGANQKLGFEETKETTGLLKHSVWEIDVANSQEKLYFFIQEFEKRFMRLQKEDLSFTPETIDIDNPRRTSVKETVLKRLKEKAWDSSEQKRLLFGYPKAPILILQENAKLLLRIPKANNETHSIFEKIIWSVLNEALEIFPYPTNLSVSDFEIEICNLNTEAEAEKSAQKLSEIGQIFFEATNAVGVKVVK